MRKHEMSEEGDHTLVCGVKMAGRVREGTDRWSDKVERICNDMKRKF